MKAPREALAAGRDRGAGGAGGLRSPRVCKSHDAQVEAIEALVRALRVGGGRRSRRQEAAEGRVRALKERFLAGYRDPDPKQARLAARDGEAPGARGGRSPQRSGIPA